MVTLLSLLLATQSSLPAYTFQQLELPPSLITLPRAVSNEFYFTPFPPASRYGTYFLTRARDAQGNFHFLIYGPNSLTKVQDISGSAGPYGPNTKGKLWYWPFDGVNDEGITITQDSHHSGVYALYNKETHLLQDMPSGFTAFRLNNNNNVVGPYLYTNPTTHLNYNSAFTIWDSGTNKLKFINPDPSINWDTWGSGYDANADLKLTYFNTFDLSDSDQFATGGTGSIDGAQQQVAFVYQEGPPTMLNYDTIQGSNSGYEFGDVTISAINDKGQTTGYGAFPDGHWHGFVGDLNNNRTLLNNTGEPGNPATYGISIDNRGDVLGYDQQYGIYLWGPDNNPVSLISLSNGAIPANASISWSQIYMDLNGRIYGIVYENGTPISFIMTPLSG